MAEIQDIFIIGGGINGAGIARDAAGRGLSVTLCEQGDLGEWTSSRSGKLVHGGLRYLEYYEFRLVREALIEREVLLRSAPHIIWPLRFVLPHSPADRPAWLIRLGLFLYDHLGGRKLLPPTRVLDLHNEPAGRPLKKSFRKGFEYSDCWVDDARLVVLNALSARDNGADILTRTRFESADRQDNYWRISTVGAGGARRTHKARVLVNAAGPWVNRTIGQVDGAESERKVRLVKGSHIVVPKFWQGDHAYLVQHNDGRVIFINPYEQHYALLGTTDIPQDEKPENVAIEDTEVSYLLEAVHRYFDVQLSESDIINRFSGVRPLFDDDQENPSAVTRDYVFDISGGPQDPPLLSVFGGKITTFRKLSEHALAKVKPWLPEMREAWTRDSHLPGGDIVDADFDRFESQLLIQYAALPDQLVKQLARRYGTRIHDLLGDVRAQDELGSHFGNSFYEIEARYLIDKEWACTADDILYRRTKHGLHLTEQEKLGFLNWLNGEMAKAS